MNTGILPLTSCETLVSAKISGAVMPVSEVNPEYGKYDESGISWLTDLTLYAVASQKFK